MSTNVLSGERAGLAARVRGVLIGPQNEWRRIAEEEPTPLIGAYVAPLTVLGAAAGLGAHLLYRGVALDADLVWAGIAALLYVALAIAAVTAAAMLIAFLVRRFGAEIEHGRAGQLAAYASTPILVAGLGALIPPLAALLIGAGIIYALILLGLGVGRLVSLPDPENNAPRFVLTFAAIAAAFATAVAAFAAPALNAGREALSHAMAAAAPAVAATETPPRPEAELAIERLAQSDGAQVLADPARLAEQFPDTLPGGFARRSVTTAQGGGVARADATYAQGGATLNVAVIQFSYDVDAAAAAGLFDVAPDGAREDGYARSQSIDGRFYAEQVDGDSARYVVIGRGVAMIAEGAATADQARAAVETIGLQRLEAAFGR
ncbi:MAG: hypothetical protein A4S17_06915 [Proteobacteria bacterium HN_bin10]|nr:MAG: hypothetical protein A4S17_06915 [Proteobacteria bacterium HN_bin10]